MLIFICIYYSLYQLVFVCQNLSRQISIDVSLSVSVSVSVFVVIEFSILFHVSLSDTMQNEVNMHKAWKSLFSNQLRAFAIKLVATRSLKLLMGRKYKNRYCLWVWAEFKMPQVLSNNFGYSRKYSRRTGLVITLIRKNISN